MNLCWTPPPSTVDFTLPFPRGCSQQSRGKRSTDSRACGFTGQSAHQVLECLLHPGTSWWRNSLQAVCLLLCCSSNSFTDILLFYNLIKFLEIIRRIDEQQCAETKDTSGNITSHRHSNDNLLSGLSYPSCHFLQMSLLAHFKNKTKSIRKMFHHPGTTHALHSFQCFGLSETHFSPWDCAAWWGSSVWRDATDQICDSMSCHCSE